eukprot:2774017-Amphidinium_carterae.1
MRRLEHEAPGALIFNVIDDLVVAQIGDEEHVRQGLSDCGDLALEWALQRQLPLSAGKCQILANNARLQNVLLEKFEDAGFVVASQAQHLGADAGCTARRANRTQAVRLSNGCKSMGRLKVLRRAGGKIHKVVRAGPLPSIIWGSATAGLTLKQVQLVRSRALHAVRNFPKSGSVAMAMEVFEAFVERDPASLHHQRVASLWVQTLEDHLLPTEWMQDALCYSALRLTKARSPWGSVHGPVGAWILVAARLHWTLVSADEVVNDEGKAFRLSELGRKGVAAEIARATSRWTMRGATSRLDGSEQLVWLAPLRRVQQQLTDPWHKACLECAIAGAEWTQEKQWRRGMAESNECRLCFGGPGTVVHRVMECPLWHDARMSMLSVSTRWTAASASRGTSLDWGAWWFLRLGSSMQPKDAQMRQAGFAVNQLSEDGGFVKGVYGACPTSHCPLQTSPEAEDWALAVPVRRWNRVRPTTVFSDCAGTVHRVQQGPGLGSLASELQVIWREVWRQAPLGIQMQKVAAHRSLAEVRDDPWQFLLWRGNGIADRFAKRGAFQHPGGEAQLRRGMKLAICVQLLLLFKAWQLRQLAAGEVADMQQLPVKGQARPGRLLGPRRLRRLRVVWQMPDWVKALASQVPVPNMGVGSRGVAGAAASRALPLRLVAQRGADHEWRLFEVRNLEDEKVGDLLACVSCGCYLQGRAKWALIPCRGMELATVALKSQRRQILEGRHPQRGQPYASWSLHPAGENELTELFESARVSLREGIGVEVL